MFNKSYTRTLILLYIFFKIVENNSYCNTQKTKVPTLEQLLFDKLNLNRQ